MTYSISEKLHTLLLKANLPLAVEIVCFGFCSRPWLLDHGTTPPPSVPRIDLQSAAEVWIHDAFHHGHWHDFGIDELAKGTGVKVGDIRMWLMDTPDGDFRSWKTRMRIQFSKELIMDGASLGEAARRAGFRDMKNFSRQFRRITGCSPSQWNKRPPTSLYSGE